MKKKFIVTALLLALVLTNAKSQNLLMDSGFELSVPNGDWPSSGMWESSWYPYDAGAVTTSTSVLKGNCGLWMYTSAGYSFSRPYQEVPCEPLITYTAGAYLRSPYNRSWTNGTNAFVRITFLNPQGYTIKTATSDSLFNANTGWHFYSVSLKAPQNAASVRFIINLESTNGQSILNVDNCSLSILQ